MFKLWLQQLYIFIALPNVQALVIIALHLYSSIYIAYSAGIGRTCTYIALDALYKGGKTTGKINVAEYVKVMRSNRMNMVQTYVSLMMIMNDIPVYF